MAARFELGNDSRGEFIFRLKAGNGEIILKSESYSSKAAALNGIESVKSNAPNDDRFEKLTAKNGQHYFNLRAGNHQVIGTSEMYSSESSRDKGIASVKTNAPDAAVAETAGA